MLSRSQGIVFRTIVFGETSVILHVFTEDLGLQSYLIKGARKPKSKISPSILQALHMVEFVAYHKNSGEIHTVKEIKNYPVFQEIPFHIIKSSMALFLAEVLIKTVRQHQKDPALYQFLMNSILWLDHTEMGLANFHLIFLIKLSRYLGFFPGSFEILSPEKEIPFYFDLKSGSFTLQKPLHPGFIGKPYSQHLFQLLDLNFETSAQYPLARIERQTLLRAVLDYYAYQVDGMGTIQSLEVLHEVFEEIEN